MRGDFAVCFCKTDGFCYKYEGREKAQPRAVVLYHGGTLCPGPGVLGLKWFALRSAGTESRRINTNLEQVRFSKKYVYS